MVFQNKIYILCDSTLQITFHIEKESFNLLKGKCAKMLFEIKYEELKFRNIAS